MINIYSNDNQLALKYLKNTEANIHNILIVASNFNIRDSDWNSSYSFYSSYSNILFKIMNSFNLSLSLSIQQVLTQYSDNENNSNLVINLFFLQSNSTKLNNHKIYL